MTAPNYVSITTPGLQGATGGSADWASPGAAIGSSAAVPTGSVFVDLTLTKTSTATGGTAATLTHNFTVTPSGTSTAVFWGAVANVSTTGGQSMTGATVVGGSYIVAHANSATLGILVGVSGSVSTSSGNVTTAYALQAIMGNSGANTITAAHGVHVYTTTNTGGGVITTNVGLYIEAQTAGATNYAIYTNSGTVRFGDTVTTAGDVGIATTPSYRLHVVDTLTNVSGADRSIYAAITATPASAPAVSTTWQSLNVSAVTASASAIDMTNASLYALVFNATHQGTATLGSAIGIVASITNTSTGTITNAFGISIGSVSAGGGAVTTMYGIYINAQTAAGTNYAIFTAGSTQSDFGGLVRTGGLRVDADAGSGVASTLTLTHTTDTPTADPGWASSDTAPMTPPDAYLKIYIGTQAYTVPGWVT